MEGVILYLLKEIKRHLGNREFEMEIQQQKSSTPSASNVSTILSSQNKIKSPVSQCFTNINHHSYNKPLVWNHFVLLTAGR
jgi:hypothetical protein